MPKEDGPRIYFSKDIPDGWEKLYGPFEPDWRPEHMRELPRILTHAMCGCYLHRAANYEEWIFCPIHAAAPKLLALLEKTTTLGGGHVHTVTNAQFSCEYCKARASAKLLIEELSETLGVSKS